ncbi:hypothetical protein SO802_018816 [Lithocarpus litseifolius]|uniref:DUF4283 domain-containing protein n=1 Tax=Lithocarpus litseifolius TaxID=425828 RepID=A0AAW2CP21_9ROSI
MEDLTKSWSCLTLSENEGSSLRLTEEQAEVEHVLAVKFLTKCALNIDAIAKTFTPLWRAKNGFKIQKEGDHVVLFTFDDKSEMEKILAAEPWSFDKHLMVIQNYDKEVDITEMEFKWVTLWVQVHDIPIRFRNRRVAERICEAIGKVNLMLDDNESEGDGFIRIRVTIDVSKPLSRGRVISLDSGKELWVESEGSFSKESKQFGPWIRAPPFFPSRKNVIKVPGFFSRRGKETPATSPSPRGKSPVVVVRTGKPSPEIIRTEKENTANEQQGINGAESQDNLQDSRQNSYNSGILKNLNVKSMYEMEKRSTDEIFKERIEEIDRELKRFDPKINSEAKNIADTGKENILASLSHTDDHPKDTQTSRAQQFQYPMPPSRAPLSVIEENTMQKIERGVTWKRINRTEMGTDVVMEDIVGEKRRGESKDDQSELLKKRKVSQVGKKDKAETWTDEARLMFMKERLKMKNKFVAPRRNETGCLGTKHSKRHAAWGRLRSLKARGKAPWLCAGDINEITKQSEKSGGRARPHGQMQGFRDVLDECGFMDLGFVGPMFTWHKHFDNYTVWERLDRAVSTND